MTRELLLPFLAIVILVNVGVITYVMGHESARELEPTGRDSEIQRPGLQLAALSSPSVAAATTVAAPAAAPDSPERRPAPRGEKGSPAPRGGRPSAPTAGSPEDALAP